MPYSRNAKYRHHRQRQPDDFEQSTFKTVPISHTDYTGKKYAKKGNKAVVGRLRKNKRNGGKKWRIQSILEKKSGK